jgi:GTP-binding protein
MLLHCISLEEIDVAQSYETIRKELRAFDETLDQKQEILVLTKSDLVDGEQIQKAKAVLEMKGKPVLVVSAEAGEGLKELTKVLTDTLTSLD